MEIPKVIHQIWFSNSPQPLPIVCQENQRRLKKLHPDWVFLTWGGLEFSDAISGDLIPRIRNLGIRSDMLRYEILYKYGGVYLDFDMVCVKPIDRIIKDFTCFAGKQGGGCGNSIMGCTPKHPAMRTLIEMILERHSEDKLTTSDWRGVYDITGAGTVTGVFGARGDTTTIEARLMGNKDARYLQHMQMGTWQQKKSPVLS